MKVFRLLSAVSLILLLGMGVTSCNQVKDADVQNAARELLKSNPDLANVKVTVLDKIATLSGTVKDDATKAYAETAVAGVPNVKSVVNKIDVVPPAPDYSALDAAINGAITDVLKEYNKVTAAVQDGIITLSGEIKEKELPALMEKLNALSPRQIVNNITVK